MAILRILGFTSVYKVCHFLSDGKSKMLHMCLDCDTFKLFFKTNKKYFWTLFSIHEKYDNGLADKKILNSHIGFCLWFVSIGLDFEGQKTSYRRWLYSVFVWSLLYIRVDGSIIPSLTDNYCCQSSNNRRQGIYHDRNRARIASHWLLFIISI